MSKYLRLILLLLTAGVVLVSTLEIRLHFAEQPVHVFLESRTGLPVTYSAITYQFPFRFRINDLRLGDSLSCRAVTITVNPLSFLSSRMLPSYMLTNIDCDHPRIIYSPELKQLLAKLSGQPLSIKPRYIVAWTGALFSKDTLHIVSPSGFVRLDSRVTGRVFVTESGQIIEARFSASPAEKGATAIKATLNVSGTALAGTVTMTGRYHSGGSVEMTFRVPSVYAGTWSIKDGVGTVIIDGDDLRARFNAPGVQLSVRNNASAGHLDSQINFALLSKTSAGTCTIDVTKDVAGLAGTVRTRDARLPFLQCDNTDLYFQRTSSGVITARGSLLPSSYSLKAQYDPASGIQATISDNKGGEGHISGSLFPLKIAADINEWHLEGNPITAALYPGLTGTFGLRGMISPTKTIVHLSADRWQLPGERPQSFTADGRSYNDNWFYSVFTSSQDVRIQGALLANGWLSVKGIFNGFLLRDALPWFRSTLPVDGGIRGTVEYSSRGYGATELTIDGMRWGSIIQGTAVIDTHWDPDRCDVRNISLKSSSGSVIVSGQIPFTQDNQLPSLYASFHHLMVSHLCIDGGLSLTGAIDTVLGNFSGVIAGEKIRVNDQVFHSVRVPVRVGRSRIEIVDAAVDSFVKGTLFIDRIQRKVGGTINYTGFPVSLVVPGVGGQGTGVLKVEGPILRPHITLTSLINDGWYKTVPFKASGTLQYLNKTVLTDGLKITSGTGQIMVSGKLWPQPYASVRVAAMPLNALTAVGEIGASMKDLRGWLSGIATVTTKGVFIGEAVAKVTDSELRVGKGSFLLFDTRVFDISAELRNVHAGGADMFGKLQAKGSWVVSKGRKEVSIICTASNLWINQLMISKLVVPMTIRDAEVQFRPAKKQLLRVTGSIDLIQHRQILCNKLSISFGEQNLVLNGALGNGSVNIRVKGSSVDGTVLSELANLPVMVDGNADFECSASGSIDQPTMEGYLSVKKGTIEDVPFDELSAKFFVQHDMLTIEKAQLGKAQQYVLTATGLIPFSMTERGKKRALKQPMNLTINLENGDMSVLPSFINDIRSANGLINSQLRITGTLGRPVFDGYVKMVKGEMDEKRYFGRLKDISFDIDMKNSLVTINNFRARSGNGVMRMKGTVVLVGMSPDRYAVSWYTEGSRGISLVIPELPIPSPLIKNDEWRLFSNLSHGIPVFSVTLSGSAAQPLLSGWVVLENTRFSYPSIIKRSSDSPVRSFLSQLSLNLELRSGKNTWYDNELASVNVQGGILLSGKFLSPQVSGTIESVRGTISYFGTEFEINHASIELLKKTAFIEGEATTDVYGNTSAENDTITMTVDKSDFQHIKPRFVSRLNSTLSSEKALAKATGMVSETYAVSDQDYVMQQQLIRLVDSTLTTPLARNFLRKSGLADSFNVQYSNNQQPIRLVQTGSPTMAELLYGTKYSMGKNLTNQLQLGYSVIFDELNNKLDLRHELEMSYKLKRNTLVKGVYELDTHNPFRQYDKRITLEQQWRFNLFGSRSGKKADHTSRSAEKNPDKIPAPQ